MQHVVFDFDGTLVDSRQLGLDLYNEVAAKRGFRRMNDADVETLRHLRMQERFRLMEVPLHRLPALVLEFSRLYRSIVDRLQFFSGIPELLETLHQQGYRLHILSSNTEENIRAFLTTQGITVIDSVTSSRNVFGKHRLLAKFLKQHRLQPADILYVGDEERDFVACQQVKVPMVAVSWGFDSPQVLQTAGAERIIDRPSDLVTLVDAIARRV
jgi:phosphoglycolate phosphatase